MTEPLQPIAFFDFDHTLILDDSLPAFFGFVAGWARYAAAVAECGVDYAGQLFQNKKDPALADRGTYFKAHMLARLLAGRDVASLREPVARLSAWQRWNEKMVAALREHHAKGHHVVIASGSLDLYLPELVKDLPHHALLCTVVGIENGKIIPTMPLGNCVRQGKAKRVADYLAAHGPFGESWAYGNYPDDLPMMELTKHRVIV